MKWHHVYSDMCQDESKCIIFSGNLGASSDFNLHQVWRNWSTATTKPWKFWRRRLRKLGIVHGAPVKKMVQLVPHPMVLGFMDVFRSSSWGVTNVWLEGTTLPVPCWLFAPGNPWNAKRGLAEFSDIGDPSFLNAATSIYIAALFVWPLSLYTIWLRIQGYVLSLVCILYLILIFHIFDRTYPHFGVCRKIRFQNP